MISTGQCPDCFTVNSFSATNCLECKKALPWSAAVIALQSQLDEAKANSVQAQQAQQQAQRAQTAQNIGAAQAARAQNTARNSAIPYVPVAPGQALAVNPFYVFADAFVGRFAEALEGMDKAGAAWFGLFCMVASNICIVVGIHLIAQNLTSLLHSIMPFTAPSTPSLNPFAPAPNPSTPDPNTIPGADGLMSLWKLMVVAFTPWLSIAASCTLARKLFGGEERHLEGDVFIAGVTLMPFSILVLLMGMLGYGNWEVLSVLSICALSYTILLLYRGLTTISAVRDMAAALCVPLVIMSSAYFAKVVFMRLLFTRSASCKTSKNKVNLLVPTGGEP